MFLFLFLFCHRDKCFCLFSLTFFCTVFFFQLFGCSRRRFTENQAEKWWNENKGGVLRKYCPTHQKKHSNVTSHVNEIIDTPPSSID